MSDFLLSRQYFEKIYKPSSNYYKKFIKPRNLSPEEEYQSWLNTMNSLETNYNSKDKNKKWLTLTFNLNSWTHFEL